MCGCFVIITTFVGVFSRSGPIRICARKPKSLPNTWFGGFLLEKLFPPGAFFPKRHVFVHDLQSSPLRPCTDYFQIINCKMLALSPKMSQSPALWAFWRICCDCGRVLQFRKLPCLWVFLGNHQSSRRSPAQPVTTSSQITVNCGSFSCALQCHRQSVALTVMLHKILRLVLLTRRHLSRSRHGRDLWLLLLCCCSFHICGNNRHIFSFLAHSLNFLCKWVFLVYNHICVCLPLNPTHVGVFRK